MLSLKLSAGLRGLDWNGNGWDRICGSSLFTICFKFFKFSALSFMELEKKSKFWVLISSFYFYFSKSYLPIGKYNWLVYIAHIWRRAQSRWHAYTCGCFVAFYRGWFIFVFKLIYKLVFSFNEFSLFFDFILLNAKVIPSSTSKR